MSERPRIVDLIGFAATYEQMAEEASELSKAAQKMARILRDENPTPVTKEQAIASIQEEYTDVVHCAMELGLTVSTMQIYQKDKRWRERIAEHQKGE